MHDAKYMQIGFYSNDHLPLRKLLDLYVVILVIRIIFYDHGKYFLQVFLNEKLLVQVVWIATDVGIC